MSRLKGTGDAVTPCGRVPVSGAEEPQGAGLGLVGEVVCRLLSRLCDWILVRFQRVRDGPITRADSRERGCWGRSQVGGGLVFTFLGFS